MQGEILSETSFHCNKTPAGEVLAGRPLALSFLQPLKVLLVKEKRGRGRQKEGRGTKKEGNEEKEAKRVRRGNEGWLTHSVSL